MTDNGLPKTFTPEEVAEHFGWSARKLRQKARDLGACRLLGNRMVLLQEDVDLLLEATKPIPAPVRPPSHRSKAVSLALSGPTYEELIARRKRDKAKRS